MTASWLTSTMTPLHTVHIATGVGLLSQSYCVVFNGISRPQRHGYVSIPAACRELAQPSEHACFLNILCTVRVRIEFDVFKPVHICPTSGAEAHVFLEPIAVAQAFREVLFAFAGSCCFPLTLVESCPVRLAHIASVESFVESLNFVVHAGVAQFSQAVDS